MPEIRRGFRPTQVDLARKRVQLVDLRGMAFDEPFHRLTVDRALVERRETIEIALGDLERADTSHCAPDLLVFHSGRCGSTLMVNMLRRVRPLTAVCESVAVSDLTASIRDAASVGERERLTASLRAVVGALIAPESDPTSALVKFASWESMLMPPLAALYPGVPIIFLWRDPVDVVSSTLYRVPMSIDELHAPAARVARIYPKFAELPPNRPRTAAAFFAMAWASCAEVALELPASRLLILRYEDLVAHAELALDRVLSHVGWASEETQRTAVAEELRWYSKDRNLEFDKASHDCFQLQPGSAAIVHSLTQPLVSALIRRSPTPVQRP